MQLHSTTLARIIHGFLKSCAKLAWIAKRFQSKYQMLKFAQAATTDVAGFVIVRRKNAFLENTPASQSVVTGLEPGRLYWRERCLTGRRLG
jgi:hypothetical protein